jgi:1-acyl-sn-glycerol-3-phosphate acyltransferase
MILLRSIVFNVAFFANNAVWFVCGLPGLLMPYRRFIDTLAHPWCRTNLWLFRTIIGCEVEIRGRENLPEGGYLIAAKHQSAWETIALAALVPGPTYILKRELMFIPLFGLYLRKLRSVAIDRSKGSAVLATMNEEARRAVAEGRQVIIFPEGTRRPVGAPAQYKHGVAHLYAETGATCVPVAHNAGLFWPRRGFIKRPGRLVLEILAPIPPGLPREAFLERLRETIEGASRALLPEPFTIEGIA